MSLEDYQVLSEYTLGELKSLKNRLGTELVDVSEEQIIFSKKLRIVQNKKYALEKSLKQITNEIKQREDMEESKNMISEDVKKIEDFGLLSEDELCIITAKMVKTDYRKYSNYDRYLVLERICKEVIAMKKRYPEWRLTNLSNGGQYDLMPPETYYKYEYQDNNDNYFTVGGIRAEE